MNEITESARIDISRAIDIGRSYIKAVVLRKANNQVFLDNFCLMPTGKNIIATLGQIAKECNFVNKRVNISVSGKSTMVRNLWLPRMSQKELKVSLGYELGQHIPFSSEDVFFDSYIFEESHTARKEGQMRVLLAAANKQFILEKIQCLKNGSMTINLIDIDAVSLFNTYLIETSEKGAVGLIDIGSSKTIINIASGNILAFTREVEYGTMNIREASANGLSIEPSDAEEMICRNDEKIVGWIGDFAEKLSKEMWSSFGYYEGQEQQPVDKVYITGGGSLLPGIKEMLEKEVGIPVVLGYPVDKIKINLDDLKKDTFKKMAPMFSIALGLAYRTL
jgi:type IV pilus assembly protein PilM